MSRTQRRAVAVGLVAVLVIAAVVVVVNRYVLEQEWGQSDHHTTSAPPGALTGNGPPPGPLTTTWRASTQTRPTGMAQFDQVSNAIVDDQLVTTTARGFDVRDARTGGPRWYYHRNGWSLLGWSATGGVIVAYFERVADRTSHVMIGFDAGTGRDLWRNTTVTPPVEDQARPRWPAGHGAIMVARGRRIWRGLDPRTGRARWTKRVQAGCVVPGVGSDAMATDTAGGRVGVLVTECRIGGRLRGRVVAIDPGRGRLLWHKNFDDPADLSVDVRGGITQVWDGDTMHLYGSGGGELLSRTGDEVCRDTTCPYAVAGGTIVVAIGGDTWTLLGVNARTGGIRWKRRTSPVDQLTADGRRVYTLRTRLAGALLPAAADILDPATGKGATVPLPFTYRESDSVPWTGTGGGLLYVAYPVPTLGDRGGVRLAALRAAPSGPGPDTLAGVRPSVWPDACALLTKDDVAATFAKGSDKQSAARVSVDGVTPDHPSSCTYAPDGDTHPGVSVRWVSQTPREAHALVVSLRAGYADAKALPRVGDEAYDLGTLSGEVVVRVGRYIVGVSAGRESGGIATRLARQAADRLKAEEGSPRPAHKPG